MDVQSSITFPFKIDPKAIEERHNNILRRLFEGKIKGYFLIKIKDQVIRELGVENLIKYYDFLWSSEKVMTGVGESAEYDICRMIVGIHRAHTIFLSDAQIRENEKKRKI